MNVCNIYAGLLTLILIILLHLDEIKMYNDVLLLRFLR